MREQFLMEKAAVKASIPVDMNTAAITGDRVKVAQGDRLLILINMGASTGAVVDFTLKQHNAASAGTSKVLANPNPYYKRVGAAASAMTKVEPVNAISNYVLSTDFAASEGVVAIEVLGEDLDTNGGFAWVSLDVVDSTAAKLISVVHILHNLRQGPGYSISL